MSFAYLVVAWIVARVLSIPWPSPRSTLSLSLSLSHAPVSLRSCHPVALCTCFLSSDPHAAAEEVHSHHASHSGAWLCAALDPVLEEVPVLDSDVRSG